MTFRIKSFISSILVVFGLGFSSNIQSANAAFDNLTLCKESPAFEKRLNSSVKKLENRLKLYTPESKEANFLVI
jgi:hypothetical protein